MAFREPFAAYNAATNTDAHLVRGALEEAGIEAMVVEDVSNIGMSLFGNLAEIHKPQVWIEKDDIDRAAPVLAEYERVAAERRAAMLGKNTEPIPVTCEGCGQRSEFPPSANGSVQNCPHCRAYVDVGELVGFEGWDEVPAEDAEESVE